MQNFKQIYYLNLKNSNRNLTKEEFLAGIKRIKSKMFLNGLIIGSFSNIKHLYHIKRKISKTFIEVNESLITLSTNKILDDSYIYRTQVNSKFINQPCIMNLYQYGGIFDTPKTYATFKLLETLINIQFSKNDLVGFDVQKLDDFQQSLLAVDGTYMVNMILFYFIFFF